MLKTGIVTNSADKIISSVKVGQVGVTEDNTAAIIAPMSYIAVLSVGLCIFYCLWRQSRREIEKLSKDRYK